MPEPTVPPPRLSNAISQPSMGAPCHTALVQRLTAFRPEPDQVADWGDATTPDRQHATLELFRAVARGDVPAMWLAVHAGACPNARLKPGVLPETRDQESRQAVPALLTPLAIAWWNQTHDDDGRAVAQARPSDRSLPDLGMVEALLTAGALAESNLPRLAQGNVWEAHPAFRVLERAVLDRLADPHDSSVPVPTRAVPGVPGVVSSTAHGPHLWVHRAVVHGHWAALNAWCERGGIVGTPTTDRLLAMLWSATPLLTEEPTTGPFADQNAVHAAIATVRPALLAADATVYRQEVLGLMAKLVLPLALHLDHPVHGPAGMNALGWLVELLETRPMDLVLTPTEVQDLGTFTGPRAQEIARTVEDLLLRRLAAHETSPETPVRDRPRL